MRTVPRPIPEIPARRESVEALACRPGGLAVSLDGQCFPVVRRVVELLADDPTGARAWALEPIDDFPHFEREVHAFFEHPLFRRPGMELTALEVATLVPIVRMLAATERWITGNFTSVELPPHRRYHARESNLGHVIGMLDIVDDNYSSLLRLFGSSLELRKLAHMIIGHDLLEFPWGDHGRTTVIRDGSDMARRKAEEEQEAFNMTMAKTRQGVVRAAVSGILRRYEAGKPKKFTLEAAAEGDLTAFFVKLIDLAQ